MHWQEFWMIVTKLLDNAWLEKNGHGASRDDQNVRSARWILHYQNGNFYCAKRTEISRKCIHASMLSEKIIREFRGDCGSLKNMNDQPTISSSLGRANATVVHRPSTHQGLWSLLNNVMDHGWRTSRPFTRNKNWEGARVTHFEGSHTHCVP